MKRFIPLFLVSSLLFIACGVVSSLPTQTLPPSTPVVVAMATALPVLETATDIGPVCGNGTCENSENGGNCSEDCAGPLSPQLVPFPPDSVAAKHEFYPLTGRHATLDCAACHTTEQYQGTPNTCAACHTNSIPANHYSGDCASCHVPDAWRIITFDHALAGVSDCLACHATVVPINHYAGECSACHVTTAWLPATFDHALVGATDCLACHTTDMPANHFAGQCSACHDTTAWLPATFNHALVGATDCLACHTADAPVNHFAGQCSNCHSSTTTWAGAAYGHTFPINHEGANGDCSLCHVPNTQTWTCAVCHSNAKMASEHNEEGISDISNCLRCHPTGQEGDGDGGEDD